MSAIESIYWDTPLDVDPACKQLFDDFYGYSPTMCPVSTSKNLITDFRIFEKKSLSPKCMLGGCDRSFTPNKLREERRRNHRNHQTCSGISKGIITSIGFEECKRKKYKHLREAHDSI
ncbi:hypothetical protein GUITHDRAFT_154120 [Guillardia theta CCMP2712]|uniref:Uncharacterized protein n=1 Tax=Guillardia theta (strain CCMP2712) TaxID=905079 RepID=L1IVZ6_GUITC|nr:hypothetical protein GUITHDRAFT_154120 [Guillardia theta CCMP2712]EKX40406.1 hypothetical protein GUITHDRAFT_154120 [Guillardia theta CCMP2712]|eukprot:XP_005827386.1 hypothetical protein GUITHDRAFT_154120 [Guillardia theta CCMP2712]